MHFATRTPVKAALRHLRARPLSSSARSSASTVSPVSPSSSGHSGPRFRFKPSYALGPLALAAAAAWALQPASAEEMQSRPGIRAVPTSTLLRSYMVYSACGIPSLIDASPAILHTLTHSPIPGLKAVTEAVVRRTFFAQFVAGENVGECITALTDMYGRGIGGVLNYSAESELEDGNGNAIEISAGQARAQQEQIYAEVNRALDALGEFERRVAATGGQAGSSSFALKVSGLVDPDVLERASWTLCRQRPLASKSPYATLSDAIPFPGVALGSDAGVIEGTVTTKQLPTVTGAIEPLGLLAADHDVTDSDLGELKALWSKLCQLSEKARDNGVKLMIDAEHASTQPALDAMTLLLSRVYNKPIPGHENDFHGPVIFGTYQSYLRRAPALVHAWIADAEENGYALGVKLVRGAYYVAERKKWIDESRSGPDPIWPTKAATDKAYDDSLATLASTLAQQLKSERPDLALSVVFATHNAHSVEKVIEALEVNGLAEPMTLPPTAIHAAETGAVAVNAPGVAARADDPAAVAVELGSPRLKLRDDVRGKVFVAQLYGMRDDLTDRVAATFDSGALPVALKYIAYGQLSEVIPFLGRRAIENKSVMSGEGGAGAERARISAELWRRLTRGA